MAAQLIATNPPLRPLFSCTARASSSLPVPLAPSSMTETSALATRSMVLRDLEHFRRGGDDRAEDGARRAGFEPAVLRFDLVQVERAGDDQPKLIDVDRLLVEIVRAHARSLSARFPARRGRSRR